MLKLVIVIVLVLAVVAVACARRSQAPSRQDAIPDAASPQEPIRAAPVAPAPTPQDLASDARSHQDQIRDALVRLLEDPEGGFVVIAAPHSGKFVQFAANPDSGLLLDLPQQTLSQDEMAKAKTVFSARGSSGPQTHDGQTSFQETFGKDLDKATELAVAIIQQVYELPDHTALKLTVQLDSEDDFVR